jgi:hypothetical protein
MPGFMASSETAHGTHNNNNVLLENEQELSVRRKGERNKQLEINFSPNMKVVITISVLKIQYKQIIGAVVSIARALFRSARLEKEL